MNHPVEPPFEVTFFVLAEGVAAVEVYHALVRRFTNMGGTRVVTAGTAVVLRFNPDLFICVRRFSEHGHVRFFRGDAAIYDLNNPGFAQVRFDKLPDGEDAEFNATEEDVVRKVAQLLNAHGAELCADFEPLCK
jgi:hypothetical protein